MGVRPITIIKLLILAIILVYVSLIPTNLYTFKIDAFFVLILSLGLVIKGRNNTPLTVMFIFILYVNYSIVMGEYFIGGYLSVPFTAFKTKEIYGLSIRVLLLFMSILMLFYNKKKYNPMTDTLELKDNWIVFYLIIFSLIFSLIIGVDHGNFDSYDVRISPIFEYSKLLFLFAYLFSGESKFRKNIIVIMAIIFIFQDAFYGGRITSLQIIIFLAVTLFVKKLSFTRILVASIIGIVLMSIIGVYRSSYEFNDFSIIFLFKGLFFNYFVFDTATFAYYASATHVAAAEVSEIAVRLNSLLQFCISVVAGSQDISSEVTNYVRLLGFDNLGGGLVPTHFYFWLGWIGVITIGFIVVMLINNLNYRSVYQHLLFLGVIITAPRWYLYSPNQLFRGVLFFITVLWMLFFIIKSLTLKKGKSV